MLFNEISGTPSPHSPEWEWMPPWAATRLAQKSTSACFVTSARSAGPSNSSNSSLFIPNLTKGCTSAKVTERKGLQRCKSASATKGREPYREEKEFTAKMLCPKRRLLQIEELAEGCNGLLKVLKGKRGGPLAAVGQAHRVGDRAQLQKWQMLQK